MRKFIVFFMSCLSLPLLFACGEAQPAMEPSSTTDMTTEAPAAPPQGVKLATVEEARAFFEQQAFLLRGRIYSTEADAAPQLTSVEIELERGEERTNSSQPERWLCLDVPLGSVESDTGVLEGGAFEGMAYRCDSWEFDDGWVKYIFVDGMLRSIETRRAQPDPEYYTVLEIEFILPKRAEISSA